MPGWGCALCLQVHHMKVNQKEPQDTQHRNQDQGINLNLQNWRFKQTQEGPAGPPHRLPHLSAASRLEKRSLCLSHIVMETCLIQTQHYCSMWAGFCLNILELPAERLTVQVQLLPNISKNSLIDFIIPVPQSPKIPAFSRCFVAALRRWRFLHILPILINLIFVSRITVNHSPYHSMQAHM